MSFIKKQEKQILLIVASLFAAGLFTFFLTFTQIRRIDVHGLSMYPTLNDGEKLFINYSKNPKIGDIIVFKESIHGSDRYLIKRVIAKENQTVYAKNNRVYIDGHRLVEPYLTLDAQHATGAWALNETKIDTVPRPIAEDYFFVMGDNRKVSMDSRSFGCIHRDQILGILPDKK